MGGLLQRSATQRDETGVRVRKDKRQRRQDPQQWDAGFDHDELSVSNSNENHDPNMNFTKSYDLWSDKYDQKPSIHADDPPGAPRSYSPNYSLNQHDIMSHQWSPSQNLHNSYYSPDYLQSVAPFHAHYNPNQQIQSTMFTPAFDPSPTIKPHERSPKRVQFASPPSGQKSSPSQTTPIKPLHSTHSWGELQPAVLNACESKVNRPMRLSNRSSMPRPLSNACKPISSQSPLQRPVYIGIDHQATLAERGRRISTKRHRKNTDFDPSDELNFSSAQQQTRSQSNHQTKHRKPTDSPRSDNELMRSQHFDSLQSTLSLAQRPILKSTSAIRITQNSDLIALASNDIRTLKSRNARRQQSAITTETKPLTRQENRRQPAPPTGSPLFFHTETSRRRIEQSHSSSSVIRVPLSRNNRQQQQQHSILSTMTSKAGISHTRM